MPASRSTFDLPLTNGGTLQVDATIGEILFVVGSNGTGKSSLMYTLHRNIGAPSLRITGHRQIWFNDEAMEMSVREIAGAKTRTGHFDRMEDSRFKDGFHHERAHLSLSNLLLAHNIRQRTIADFVDKRDLQGADAFSLSKAPLLATVNQILLEANIHIAISISSDGSIVARKGGSSPFNVSRLSDGERNALLIISDVIAAEAGTFFLIDEPERHLHHSIVAPLLKSLFLRRDDCAFIVSTHDVSLPVSCSPSKALLLRSHDRSTPVLTWTADLLASGQAFDEEFLYDILGSRRKILFVEGDESSLDRSIYSLLFPNVSVVSKRTCREVEQAVAATQSTADFQWLKAYGIIDGDGKTADEITALRSKSVYALQYFSVESLYYHPKVQRMATARLVQVTGGSLEALLSASQAAALTALGQEKGNLCSRVIHHTARHQLLSQLPTLSGMRAPQPVSIQLDIPVLLAQEEARFDAAIRDCDLDFLIGRYPIRYSRVIPEIAKALTFKNRIEYESTVRKLIVDDPSSRQFFTTVFGDLLTDMQFA